MTISVTRALAGLVLGCVLLSGCTTSSSDEAGPGRASTGAPTPVDGAVGSTTCSLGREQLSFVVRDWGRVFGSIGRGDHAVYTHAFATKLDGIEDAARRCNGAAEFAAFLSAARRIDARARRPTPSYALYDAASTHGSSWLTKVGYGNNALSVG